MKAQRCSSLDIISTLPQNIIETILCLLPIQDAVRTSILSRSWRYNWVKIPKLEFDYRDMFQKSGDENELSILEQSFEEPPSERKHLTKRCKVFYAIFQVLMLHKGPICEFALFINANNTSVEIDQIIHYLSKENCLKKLGLGLGLKYVFSYKVPVSVFSLQQLTDLHLIDCNLGYPRMFNVSGSLTGLFLEDVNTDAKALLHLISKSPLLKSLTMLTSTLNNNSHGLISPAYFFNDDGSTTTELLKCLPVLENLSISVWVIKCFTEDVVPKELPAPLIQLKYLYLDDMCFVQKYGLAILFLLIRSSPNLEKLKLQMDNELAKGYLQSKIDSVALEDYSDIWLEHLNELQIVNFANLKPELRFVKLILANSPVLKKVRILLYDKVAKDEELEMLKILLCSPRTSLGVKIFVDRRV